MRTSLNSLHILIEQVKDMAAVVEVLGTLERLPVTKEMLEVHITFKILKFNKNTLKL